MPNGTSAADAFTAPTGSSTFNGLGGIDTIIFDFKLTDATFTWIGNELIVETATSRTVLTGFEVFQFKDGTVHNDDSDPLVDDLYYYVNSPDVWSAHADADAHYRQFGWHENRNPNAFFNTKLYLSIYHDVTTSGLSPTQHYDKIGWIENRLFSLDFDARQYLALNPDVAAAHVDPLAHFLSHGAAEGRSYAAPLTYPALNGFDYVYYLQHSPDVLAAGVDPLRHFRTFGWKEGRNPNAFFDTAGYLATYADVAAAGVNPLEHFH
jgi:serralysin